LRGEVHASPFVFSEMIQLFDLKNERGEGLRVSILGYQFPDEPTDYFDANWLVARIEGAQQGRNWRADEPCLLTYEIPGLATWFRARVDGTELAPNGDLFTQSGDEAGFMEPCIHFKFLSSGGTQNLRIFLELEARPPWQQSNVAYLKDCYLDFDLNREELLWIAAELEAASARIAIRGEALRRHEPQPSRDTSAKLEVKFGKHVKGLKRLFSGN
jgi:hypothetical protein